MATSEMSEDAFGEMSGCRRCGECCRLGGPALHAGDLDLFTLGVLGPQDCVTLRPGEMVHDQPAGRALPLVGEVVKLKEAMGPCRFLRLDDAEDVPLAACAIHADRPRECRAQDCRDPSAVLEMYERDRLDRAAVIRALGLGEGALKLVLAYETRFGLAQLQPELASEADPQRVGLLVAQDAEFRRLAVARAGIPPEALEFLFGRPLAVILPGLLAARR